MMPSTSCALMRSMNFRMVCFISSITARLPWRDNQQSIMPGIAVSSKFAKAARLYHSYQCRGRGNREKYNSILAKRWQPCNMRTGLALGGLSVRRFTLHANALADYRVGLRDAQRAGCQSTG